MGYVGIFTYRSLLSAINMNSAIQSDYVILNQDIWRNTRKHFERKDEADFLLPVLGEEDQLVCFAYMDCDANREIRMLRELIDHPEAMQFTELYPEC